MNKIHISINSVTSNQYGEVPKTLSDEDMK